MSTQRKLFRRIPLLFILPLAVATASFIFLRGDYFNKLKYDKPLRGALTRKDLKAVKHLVEQGADVNTTIYQPVKTNQGDYGYSSPLLMAVRRGDVATARLFLQKGADTLGVSLSNASGAAGQQIFWNPKPADIPLWSAVMREDEEMIKLLIKHKTEINFDVWNGFTPFTLLKNSCNDKPTTRCRHILKMLKQAGAKEYIFP